MKAILKTIKYPSKKEIINNTILVTSVMILVSLCIFGIDTLVMEIYNIIF